MCQPLQEPMRYVLVKEQFHAGIVISLRSRSAAKARHARMSSRVRSGKYFVLRHAGGEIVQDMRFKPRHPPTAGPVAALERALAASGGFGTDS